QLEPGNLALHLAIPPLLRARRHNGVFVTGDPAYEARQLRNCSVASLLEPRVQCLNMPLAEQVMELLDQPLHVGCSGTLCMESREEGLLVSRQLVRVMADRP